MLTFESMLAGIEPEPVYYCHQKYHLINHPNELYSRLLLVSTIFQSSPHDAQTMLCLNKQGKTGCQVSIKHNLLYKKKSCQELENIQR